MCVQRVFLFLWLHFFVFILFFFFSLFCFFFVFHCFVDSIARKRLCFQVRKQKLVDFAWVLLFMPFLFYICSRSLVCVCVIYISFFCILYSMFSLFDFGCSIFFSYHFLNLTSIFLMVKNKVDKFKVTRFVLYTIFQFAVYCICLFNSPQVFIMKIYVSRISVYRV